MLGQMCCRNFYRAICVFAICTLGIAQRSFSDYTFTKVTDSSTLPTNNLDLASIDPFPQINNSRQIALGFRGNQQNQQQSMAIYRWESGTYTRIVGSGDSILGKPPVFSLSPPVISNSGSIAFEALFRSGIGGSDRTYVRHTNSGSFLGLGQSSSSFRSISINSQDRVFASVSEFNSNRIRSWDAAGTPRDHSVTPLDIPFDPRVDGNDNNQISFINTYPGTNQSLPGVYVATDEGVRKIANTSDGFIEFAGRPAINNLGQVAFSGITGTDPFGRASIYRGGLNSPLELIANRDVFTNIFASSVAINDLGNVLFSASSNGSTAIFSGGDPLNDRIIGTGDSLDGGRIVGLTFQNGMLNDQNEFVFYATLDDNNDGLADRGTVFLGLTAVPEPTSCVLCLTSCLTVICLKRARKKSR